MKAKLSLIIRLSLFMLIVSLSNHGFGQTTIFSEGFENSDGFSIEGALSTTPVGNNGWRSSAVAYNWDNNWAGFTYSGTSITGRSLMIAAADNLYQYPGDYFEDLTTNKYAYVTVNATGYENITLTFKWRCYGDLFNGTLYDYGMVTYNTGSGWQDITTGGTYGNGRYGAGDANVRTATVTLPASANNKSFQIGFRWINDNVDSYYPGFVVDDIEIKATPISSDRTLTVSEAYAGASYANGSHTIANNTSVTATSGTRVGYVVTGWEGTGSVPATGTGGSATFTITENSTINWLWEQTGTPKEISFYNYGGTEQLTFNNSRIDTNTPIFRMSHSAYEASEYEVEINTAPDFTGTAWTQTFTGTYPVDTEANFTFNNGFVPTNNTTYYVRARVKGAADVWSDWTSETYSFTYQTPKSLPDWFQTTQAQFASDELAGVEANASHDVVAGAGGSGNVITNGSFEPNLSGWTIVKPSWYSVTSEPYGNTDGSNALNIYNNDPYSFGNFRGDNAGVYQTVNMTGVSNVLVDLGYESTPGSNLNVYIEMYVSDVSQTGIRTGTKILNWKPTSNLTTENAQNIDISSFGFTGNKLIKIVAYLDIPSTDYVERYFYIDNLRTTSSPQGTITSTPIHLASVQGATAYQGITWSQTLGGGDLRLKVQESTDGISGWTDVTGYDNISEAGNGEKTFDLSGMTAYPHIRLVGDLDGENVVLHDWSVQFQADNCSIETIWNGLAWSNGVPDSNSYKIIFEGNYTSSSDANYPTATGLVGCSVEVRDDSEVVISSGHSVSIDNEITVDNANGASFTLKSDANLLQINPDVENEGEIIVEREATVPSIQYNFWSSPVAGQNLYEIYDNIPANRVMTYNTDDDYYTIVPNPTTADFGIGYSIKGPSSNYPDNSSGGEEVTAVFTGEPHNESATTNFIPLETVGQGFNLIGNPFPSNLNLEELYALNEDQFKVSDFYFWDNTNNTALTQQGADYENYEQNNYAVYNVNSHIGTSAPHGSESKKPNGIVKPGQGILIQASDNAGGITITNSMRTIATKINAADDDAPYYKNGSFGVSTFNGSRPKEGKFWLELVNSENIHIQIAVGYLNQADDVYDKFDTEVLNENASDNIYSFSSDIRKLAINGRKPFTQEDVIPLGVKLFKHGKYKILLEEVQGIFEGHQTIYLKDKYLNKIHNLFASDYEFEGAEGEYTDRFEILYKLPLSDASVLSTANLNQLKILQVNDEILISSTKDKILEVEVFNLAGWSIYQKANVNANEWKIPSMMLGKQIIVVKALTQTGEVVTKKIINK